MPVFKTPFNGYSVKFSPFYENRVAVAAAQNFGILGNGRLHVLDLSPDLSLPIAELVAYDAADGVYDVTWSESHDSIVVAAIAYGSIKLYNLALPPTQNPIRSFRKHTCEGEKEKTRGFWFRGSEGEDKGGVDLQFLKNTGAEMLI